MQIPFNQLRLDVEEQEHEPLSLLSGSFTGQSYNWSIVEKEAFAVVESMTRLDFLTSTAEVSVFMEPTTLV